MASPFPGMDPYLENPAFWLDFHSSFITYLRDAIFERLPDEYEASIGEYVCLVEQEPDQRKRILPDVGVSHQDLTPFPSGTTTAVATLECVTIPLAMEDGPKLHYVEILHQPERALVTVLEVLSPTNKIGQGRSEYAAKRNAILRQNVHLVELDLLRGGQRPPMQKPWPAGDCSYLVSRYEERPDAQVFSWTLRQPLPTVPIPLRAPDADIAIDLAAVFNTTYERGRFGRRIPYRAPCPVPLSAADAEWARELLEAKARG